MRRGNTADALRRVIAPPRIQWEKAGDMTPLSFNRRAMLRRLSTGFGAVAAQALLAGNAPASSRVLQGIAQSRPKARSVIFCYMSGGVSHIDSFDPKPRLRAEAGKPMPVPVHRTMFNNNGNIMPSLFEFGRHGQSGLEISTLFPHIAGMADELAVIRSMTSTANEHAQGNYCMHTGFPFMGHPSAGAWVSYGLGSENRDVPGFVVLQSGGAVAPHGGVGLFSSGYLPAQHQASFFRVDGKEPLRNIHPNEPADRQKQRINWLKETDGAFFAATGETQIEAAIRNAETACAMQTEVPELCELDGETEATKKLYAMDSPDPQTAAYGRQCLVARRLVERGVRFVELSCINENIGAGNAPNPWDQHGQLKEGHGAMAHQVDQPIAGMLRDLRARGLLDSTLVIFTGEFGRTPFSQGNDGRDHNPYGFSLWMAGGGVRGGTSYGATDEYGYHAVENVCTIYDLWATALHLMGVDHEALTYRYGGRDFRLTDVHGNVIRDVLA